VQNLANNTSTYARIKQKYSSYIWMPSDTNT
jgi:hypothetical protein